MIHRFALFALLLILLAGCIKDAPAPESARPDPATATRVLPGRALLDEITTPTVTPIVSDPIVQIVIVRASGQRDIIYNVPLVVTATATSAPTSTPPPTNTPRVTVTPTPSPTPINTPTATAIGLDPTPTRTPWPSFTPTATDLPTATPEILTATPTTTPQPTVPPKTCQLRSTSGMNVRYGPGLGFPIVASWPQGETRVFFEFKTTRRADGTEDYTWGHHAAGWSAVYQWPVWSGGILVAGDQFYVAGALEADACRDVVGWPANLLPPVPIARTLLGFHLIVGANDTFILNASQVGGAKGTTHTADLLRKLKAANPNAVTIYRSLHNQNGMIDGPLPFEWHSPEVYYAKLKPFLEPGMDLYEFINEWALPKRADGSDDWEQWQIFTIAMLTLFAQDEQCALFGSFGPGGPDLPGWPYVINVMKWSDTHPCQPGRYHGWAIHQTLLMPDWVNVDPGSYIRNPWIVDRDLKFQDYALAHGYDLRRFKGGVWITEGGWSDYSTIGDRDYSCQEVAAGWKMTEADYTTRRPWIRGVALWTLTRDSDPSWFNLQPCLPLLFG